MMPSKTPFQLASGIAFTTVGEITGWEAYKWITKHDISADTVLYLCKNNKRRLMQLIRNDQPANIPPSVPQKEVIPW